MSVIVLPSRFGNRQPQLVPDIDRGNPIARKLEFAWVASNPSVLPRAPVGVIVSNNTTVRRPSLQGMAASVSGVSSSLYTNANAIFFPNEWTSLTVCMFPAIQEAAISQVTVGAGLNTNDRSLYINASFMLTGYIYDTADKFASDTVAMVAGVPYIVAASSGGTSIDVWKNGVNVASTVTTSGGYGYGGSPPLFILGHGRGGNSGAGAGLGSNAVIALQLWWTRALSRAEHSSLAENPYQIFKGKSRSFAALVGASSATRPQVFACT